VRVDKQPIHLKVWAEGGIKLMRFIICSLRESSIQEIECSTPTSQWCPPEANAEKLVFWLQCLNEIFCRIIQFVAVAYLCSWKDSVV